MSACGGASSRIGARTLTGGRKPINAKCETVRNLPTFRDAYRARRCIVPVDAFYEWKKIGAGKQPYAIVGPDGLLNLWLKPHMLRPSLI